jgi:hypothetical protein
MFIQFQNPSSAPDGKRSIRGMVGLRWKEDCAHTKQNAIRSALRLAKGTGLPVAFAEDHCPELIIL